MRLGVYSDLVYRFDGERYSTDLSFVRFPTSLPPRVEEVVVLGRLDPAPGRAPYELPREGVRFVPLPYYPSVFHVRAFVRAIPRSVAAFAAELPRLDAVWLFGPHPLSVAFALAARRRGVPVVLGVRQHYPAYIGARLPSRAWAWARPAAWALELFWRLLARRLPTIAVGEALAAAYRGGRAPVLATGLSLVRADDILPLEEALARTWEGPLRVLAVGRLDPEKNPLLLLDVLAGLRQRSESWRLAVAGTGPLLPEVRRRAASLGLSDSVEFLGWLGETELRSEYRRSHAFLHVSLTEGLPQVLFEAQAAGLPIVATDVGGVRAALGGAALLVPPRDAGAAVEALERLRADPALRSRLVSAGHEQVRGETIDAQLDRVAEFLGRFGK